MASSVWAHECQPVTVIVCARENPILVDAFQENLGNKGGGWGIYIYIYSVFRTGPLALAISTHCLGCLALVSTLNFAGWHVEVEAEGAALHNDSLARKTVALFSGCPVCLSTCLYSPARRMPRRGFASQCNKHEAKIPAKQTRTHCTKTRMSDRLIYLLRSHCH